MKRKVPHNSSNLTHTQKKARLTATEDANTATTVRVSVTGVTPSNQAGSSRPHLHSTSHLLSPLDFTSLTTHEHISARFDTIASELLHHFRLRVGDLEEYEILELEFYLHTPGTHEDPFTHGSDEQRQSGRWYFHRTHPAAQKAGTDSRSKKPSAAGGYRGGTRKGLDLTLGGPAETLGSEDSAPSLRSSKFFSTEVSCPSSIPSISTSTRPPKSSRDPHIQPHGGALLRTIRRVSDGKVVSGPSLLVDEILRMSKASNIADLVQSKWGGDTNAFGAAAGRVGMYLFPIPPNDKVDADPPRIFRSPRIGLDLSHASIPVPSSAKSNTSGLDTTLAHPRTIFVSKPYRYFIRPHLLTANGRGHTFLGVYQGLLDSCLGSGEKQNDEKILKGVVRLTGLKIDLARQYLREYRAGRESGSLAAFVGPKGKGAGSAAASLLRMTGTLERARGRTGTNGPP